MLVACYEYNNKAITVCYAFVYYLYPVLQFNVVFNSEYRCSMYEFSKFTQFNYKKVTITDLDYSFTLRFCQ